MNTLHKYIKDLAIAQSLNYSGNLNVKANEIKKFAYKAIKNYCQFRLDVLQNKKIQEVELKVLTRLIIAGVKYAAAKFNVQYTEEMDTIVKELTETILSQVHNKRSNVFQILLNYGDTFESK
jgi:hypothetical protein